MNEFSLHPNVYATGKHKSLLKMLENAWVRQIKPGQGKIFIISAFSNYNGGVRFYDVFREHVDRGGQIEVYLAGSTAQRLSSKEVVKQLLECGAHVSIINRKRLLHAKCYGYLNTSGQALIVSSGNFTGPGMSQNAEASVFLDSTTTQGIGFSWSDLTKSINSQNWDIYKPDLKNLKSPAWKLLFDEVSTSAIKLDETEEVSMILVLGHADTVRIQSSEGTKASKGTQYFWLSKDCFDFFPPLTIRNTRGYKTTYSTLIKMNYVDLGIADNKCRVTFEAENNFDFRLGTGKLRYSKMAEAGDIAVISRIKELEYDLRIIKKNSSIGKTLAHHAINFIGHQGKKYGFVSNRELENILKINL